MILLPMVASADAVEIDGIYYNLIDEGNYAIVSRSPNKYTGNIVIPESVNYNNVNYSVTRISSNAFNSCPGLISVTIPNSVKTILTYAFENSTDLTSVTIPNSVTNIGGSAFRGCKGLTSVIIPNSVTNIEAETFYGCTSLTTVTIPNSVTSIGYMAFSNCSSLTTVTIPNSVTSIGEWAFSDCSSLTSVTIPNSVTSIAAAFSGCSSLTSVTIPNSVTDLGSAFYGCSSLTSVTIPNSVTNIETAFSNCSALTSVTIPNSLTSIGNAAFRGCTSLTSVTIPNSVTSIGRYAFSDCSSLTSVTIPNSVTSIDEMAYQGCSSLTSITIPKSVTSIGDRAFSGCGALNSVIVEEGNTKYDSRNNCNAIIETTSNNLLSGCKNTTIPNSVTSIKSCAFYDCSALTSVTIPQSVTSIGTNSFSGCRIETVLTKNSKTQCATGFNVRTCQHAMLYIPEGTWAEAVYDGGWYMFNNIREIAMQADELSSSRTYTLMDTQSFGYAVYDDASNQVKMVKAFYSIDEEDPNNCWVVKSQAGKKYLYNIGARKYARIGIDGKISLTSLATPVSLSEGDGGIVIDADLSRQWGFVKNNTITDVTGIEAPTSDKDDSGSIYYSLDGQRKESPRKGVNIMKMNDGTIKKVIVK